jgi:chromosome segregation ATPase
VKVRVFLKTLFWIVLILGLPLAVFLYMDWKLSQLADQLKTTGKNLHQLHGGQVSLRSELQKVLESSELLNATLSSKDEEIFTTLTSQLSERQKAIEENRQQLDQINLMLKQFEQSLRTQQKVREEKVSELNSEIEKSRLQTEEIRSSVADFTRQLRRMGEEFEEQFSQFEEQDRRKHELVDEEWRLAQERLRVVRTELSTEFNRLKGRVEQLSSLVNDFDRRLRRLEASSTSGQR